MQVTCYQRNWNTEVCVAKCPFHWECEREYLKNHDKEDKGDDDKYGDLIEMFGELIG